MMFLTKDEAEALAISRGYRLEQGGALETRKEPFGFAFPSHRTGMAVMARDLTHLLGDFGSALFIVTEWGVWPSSEDKNLFDRFRQSVGMTAPFPEYPGHLFNLTDAKDLASFLHLILAFSWGGFLFLVGENDRKLGLFVSHDEWARIWVLTEEDEKKAADLALRFSPQEDAPTVH